MFHYQGENDLKKDDDKSTEAIREAIRFVDKLKANSPKFDGIPLRDVLLQDINYDGIWEILEEINPIEEETQGMLDVEIYLAFVWINVYGFKNGKYSKANEEFSWFMKTREIYYEFWKRQIAYSINLNESSKAFLESNDKKKLLGIIDEYISRIRSLKDN